MKSCQEDVRNPFLQAQRSPATATRNQHTSCDISIHIMDELSKLRGRLQRFEHKCALFSFQHRHRLVWTRSSNVLTPVRNRELNQLRTSRRVPRSATNKMIGAETILGQLQSNVTDELAKLALHSKNHNKQLGIINAKLTEAKEDLHDLRQMVQQQEESLTFTTTVALNNSDQIKRLEQQQEEQYEDFLKVKDSQTWLTASVVDLFGNETDSSHFHPGLETLRRLRRVISMSEAFAETLQAFKSFEKSLKIVGRSVNDTVLRISNLSKTVHRHSRDNSSFRQRLRHSERLINRLASVIIQ